MPKTRQISYSTRNNGGKLYPNIRVLHAHHFSDREAECKCYVFYQLANENCNHKVKEGDVICKVQRGTDWHPNSSQAWRDAFWIKKECLKILFENTKKDIAFFEQERLKRIESDRLRHLEYLRRKKTKEFMTNNFIRIVINGISRFKILKEII